MLTQWLRKFFGNNNSYILQQAQSIVHNINKIEPKMIKLSDQKLQNKTQKLRTLIQQGIALNNILPEAFAVVREASKRIFGMRHFDVQLLGGIVLHQNCIAEMRTGEGKTLTSTLPAYLHALKGNGVHIVTMNDYLAKRDAQINKPLFEFLGLTVGLNAAHISIEKKRQAYLCDITYGTNNEYGFDYLKDNMIFSKKDCVQRSLDYALIDEVDSILIDESRTPLIISGPIESSSKIYYKINTVVLSLLKNNIKNVKNKYFSVDEEKKQVYLTDIGLIKVEKLLVQNKILNYQESLYSSNNIILLQYVSVSLRAHKFYFKNIDYIINSKHEIVIVDEHTGRIMTGRRWSEGLHQAIEAKENVYINDENKTLASITFQNYFRLYKHLSGMTGTAITESFEFNKIYNLNTVLIPTNKPMIRKDLPDLMFFNEQQKYRAIIQDIQNCVKKKRPVLVGTISIEKSEKLSTLLKNKGIIHNVLNALSFDREAEIISEAGKKGSVTIATNMAGRGTDIVLGGSFINTELNIFSSKLHDQKKFFYQRKKWKQDHDFVVSVGGLHIIGTERHESRRIDNQLRGRAGRQGDPGSSRFYLSMDDSLMRIFASKKIQMILKKLGMYSNDAIEHPLINKAIENAQHTVENRNFEIRKQLLEYDDIINDQRFVIYQERNHILCSDNINKNIYKLSCDVFKNIIKPFVIDQVYLNYSGIQKIEEHLLKYFNMNINFIKKCKLNNKIDYKFYINFVFDFFNYFYKNRKEKIGKKKFNKIEKNIMIKTLDIFWTDHLASMDHMKKSIHLCGYVQKDPKQEYKKEAFIMFLSMLKALKKEVVILISEFIFNKKFVYN
ncbi:preprotein translocase subunit SecA [Buchnera aphidicola (Thelaxes californica)]|uniref:Protein translocase subunit SecA n=1 Tax=Buchnera aphidicola (Thelaxes californica) TaxID=1315998 RepID=A0A4D6YLZ1_9GAMM|nr:preprotein translocase subunit SecA [Buchnera aphidicola]QCI26708.1 preprotein translocase subunit SecA [Buchnera aphidicola (Thelaxes californica)]